MCVKYLQRRRRRECGRYDFRHFSFLFPFFFFHSPTTTSSSTFFFLLFFYFSPFPSVLTYRCFSFFIVLHALAFLLLPSRPLLLISMQGWNVQHDHHTKAPHNTSLYHSMNHRRDVCTGTFSWNKKSYTQAQVQLITS
uniref:Uncharacterized protein n=1 Tax=Trypanosoma vivax (strain Y486) TaxID=1055687 RepID=G0U7S6_TRYVY|nr:hypothetical protein, unlikely [Trypanosoma vivax Y486]